MAFTRFINIMRGRTSFGALPRRTFNVVQSRNYLSRSMGPKTATHFIKKYGWLPRKGLKRASPQERVAVARKYVTKLKGPYVQHYTRNMSPTREERQFVAEKNKQRRISIVKSFGSGKLMRTAGSLMKYKYAVPDRVAAKGRVYGDLSTPAKIPVKEGQIKALRRRITLSGGKPQARIKSTSLFGKLMNTLSFTGRVSAGFASNVVTKGLGGALKRTALGKVTGSLLGGRLPTKKLLRTSTEAAVARGAYQSGFTGVLKRMGVGKLGTIKTKSPLVNKLLNAPLQSLGVKTGRAALGFAGDVLLDPMTYLTFGLGGVIKGAIPKSFIMRSAMQKALGEVAQRGLVKGVSKTGARAFRGAAIKGISKVAPTRIGAIKGLGAAGKLLARPSAKGMTKGIISKTMQFGGMGTKQSLIKPSTNRLAMLNIRNVAGLKPITSKAGILKRPLTQTSLGTGLGKITGIKRLGVGIKPGISRLPGIKSVRGLGIKTAPTAKITASPFNPLQRGLQIKQLKTGAAKVPGLTGLTPETSARVSLKQGLKPLTDVPQIPATKLQTSKLAPAAAAGQQLDTATQKSLRRHFEKQLARTGETGKGPIGKLIQKEIKDQIDLFRYSEKVIPTRIEMGAGKYRIPLLKSEKLARSVEHIKDAYGRPLTSKITRGGWDIFRQFPNQPQSSIDGYRMAQKQTAYQMEDFTRQVTKELRDTTRGNREEAFDILYKIENGELSGIPKGTSPAVAKAATYARKSFDKMEGLEKAAGIDYGHVENYVSHIPELKDAFRSVKRGGTKTLGTEAPGFAKARVGGQVPLNKDVGSVLVQRNAAHASAMGRATYVQDLTKQFGVPTKLAPDDFVETTSKYATGYRFTPEVADVVNKVEKIMVNDQNVARILRSYDKLLNYWKGYSTGVIPGFHVRNFMSDIYMWYLAGNLKGAMKNMPLAARVTTTFHTKPNSLQYLTGHVGKYTTIEAAQLAKKFGIYGGGWLSSEMPEQVAKQIGRGLNPTLHKISPLNYGRKFGQLREDTTRVSHFFAQLEKGVDPQDAARTVIKYHFNYDELSDIERKVFKRIIPFYTWLRKNIPLQFEEMAAQPGKFAALGKGRNFFENISEGKTDMEQKYLPNWMEDYWAFKVPRILPTKLFTFVNDKLNLGIKEEELNKAYYYNPNLPFQDINNALNFWNMQKSGQEGLSRLSPLIKLPLQIATNTDFFKGGELMPKYGDKMTPAPGYLNYLPPNLQKFIGMKKDKKSKENVIPVQMAMWMNEANTLLANVGRALQKGDVRTATRTLSFLGGIKFIPLTEDAMLSEQNDYYMQLQEQGRQRAEKVKMGELPPLPRKKRKYKIESYHPEFHTDKYKPKPGVKLIGKEVDYTKIGGLLSSRTRSTGLRKKRYGQIRIR